MKLNTKFSLIIANVSVILFLIMLGMLFGAARIIEINRFEQDMFSVSSNFYNGILFAEKNISGSANLKNLPDEMGGRKYHLTNLCNRLKERENMFSSEKIKNEIKTLNSVLDRMLLYFSRIENDFSKISEVEIYDITAENILFNGLFSVVQNPDIYDDPFIDNLYPFVTEAYAVSVNMKDAYDEMLWLIDSLLVDINSGLDVYYRNFIFFSIWITMMSVAVTYTMSGETVKSIVKRIDNMKIVSAALAKKDFSRSIEVSGDDEIYEMQFALNEMLDSLNKFFLQVKNSSMSARNIGFSINDSSADAAAAAEEISAGVDSFSNNVVNLSNAVEHTVDATNLMISISENLFSSNKEEHEAIQDNQFAISNVTKSLESTARLAAEKALSSQDIQDFVQEGDERISATYKLLQEITSQLDEVSSVAGIIKGIASKTNMLAMNAAIESAHAGESGRGFAVVAEEIRSLAESVAQRSTLISKSINSIILSVKDANEASKVAAETFEKVRARAHDVVASLNEISGSIRDIDGNMHRVTNRNIQIVSIASKVANYYDKLSSQEKIVAQEMDNMNSIFQRVIDGIEEIKVGMEDVQNRSLDINNNSTENVSIMDDLKCRLDEFKTFEFDKS